MTEYGGGNEPGIVTEEVISSSVPNSNDSVFTLGIVGDFDTATAANDTEAGIVYELRRSSRAITLFGKPEDSELTRAVLDAFNEGASPVYATLPYPGSDTSVPADYVAGMKNLFDGADEELDIVTALSTSVADVENMATEISTEAEERHRLTLGIFGVDSGNDISDYSVDNDRVQLIEPATFADGTSVLPAVAGRKAALGLERTTINVRLNNAKSLEVSLSSSERSAIISANGVPLADEAGGVRIVDDLTTVTSNSDLQFGFSRLVADLIMQETRENQQPFIGRFNNSAIQDVLNGMVEDSLSVLDSSSVIENYDVTVFKKGAVTAGVNMDIELVDPLRNIDNTVVFE